ncbi:P-loop containing nucleoside triphosphate hydrolase protein [Ephemerocybe angulata]|uniref:ATP-dependent RNA helicase n=1 Tax=Ephemerocybe angulata TaxID=980116 RepID=A0A8H6IK33_9AGAR|nr:P-loop containing nucleoside triphosphate hydrolase protein [Tulosesus angulatus]
MMDTVKRKILGDDYVYVRTTSNRPNLIYATLTVPVSFDDMKTYDFCLVRPYHPSQQPRVLLFFESIALEAKVTNHLKSLVPEMYWESIALYHSDMSPQYLAHVYGQFTTRNGAVRVLCTTSGQSTGIDFPDVDIVILVGYPSSLAELLQRGGRCGRAPGSTGLFLVLFEPWIHEIELKEFDTGYNSSNPDRTRAALTKNSSKKDRVVRSAVLCAQSTSCLRKLFAEGLGDTTQNATEFTAQHCCTRHPEDQFELSSLLPSPLHGTALIESSETAAKKRTRNVYRKPQERSGLDKELIKWLDLVTQSDDPDINQGYFYTDDILAYSARRRIVWERPQSFESAKDVQRILSETNEWQELWGEDIYTIIQEYDIELQNGGIEGIGDTEDVMEES